MAYNYNIAAESLSQVGLLNGYEESIYDFYDFNNPNLEVWENHDFKYQFHNHFHPYVGRLIERLNKGELADLMKADYEIDPENINGYTPVDSTMIEFFKKEIELDPDGAYALYNWELFYHIPITVAVQLSKNQRFKEAQKWFHFIFDPTTDEPDDGSDSTKRFWKFNHFRENTKAKLITELLTDLANGNGDPLLIASIEKWRKTPFSPHSVAKFRPLAYQFNVVMKYIDNLIAWGDSLFSQFTIETLNEATQVYVLAANILGEKPQEIPNLKKRPKRTYRQLKDSGTFDEFSNVMTEMENEFPLNSNLPGVTTSTSDSSRLNSLYGIGKQLYFCIPRNNKLLKYWDVVADRLFKIRHCMDIEGNVRQIPLFQPPIDPGMLVKAAAAGLDIGSIIGGLNQPISNVKYKVLLQKAVEICNELKSFGSSLLSSLEKGDAERLTLLKQEHEIKLLELSKDVRYLQWKESENATASLLKTRESAYQRYRHYQILLGKEEGDFSDLSEVALERVDITEENFEEIYTDLVAKHGQVIDLEEYREEKLGLLGEAASAVSGIVGSVDSALGVGSSEHLQLNKTEDIELNVMMPLATSLSLMSGGVGAVSTILSLVPNFDASGRPLGVGAGVDYGGKQLSAAASFASQIIKLGSEVISYQGSRAAKLGSYKRRIDDWVLQNNLASKELQQIGNQLISSLIREQITKKEFENHKVQIEQSNTIDEFLKEQKFTNEDLYLWMQGEISKMYYECYKLAFDIAKKTEVTMKYEMMRKELDERDFIKFNYWNGGRKGLLSGEALYMDLKRLELAALESNKREFELTKHISINQLDPLALLKLKATGACEIDIPEWVFDLDCPGHYMRRIKNMSVSIPCIAGPYTSVNCTLSLQKSALRKTSIIADEDSYEREGPEDDRFKDYYGTVQSIVTSNAQNDSGMFEVNMRSERFLPFEGAGVISTWKIEMPEDFRQFDYDTISDVILHLRYTARQGGGSLKVGAVKRLEERISDINATGLKRLFSLRHDFPNDWHKFKTTPGNFQAKIQREHFSFLSQGKDFDEIKISLWKFEDNNLSLIEGAVVSDLNDFRDHLNDSNLNVSELELLRMNLEESNDVFMILEYSLA